MRAVDAVNYFQTKDFKVKIKLGHTEGETKLKCGRGRDAILSFQGRDILMGYLAYSIEAGYIKIVKEDGNFEK